MAVYATRADLRAACRKDSLAKLTVDPTATEVIGTGDGAETTFATPFESVTTAKVYVNGAAVTTGWALSRATGTDNRDEIVFTVPPASGAVISASADAAAIHADDLDAILASVSASIDKYLSGVGTITGTALLASLKAMAILFAQKRLRGRRNLDIVDPIESECREAERWLLAVSKGDIPLPAQSTSVSSDEGSYIYGSHDPVYSDPDEEVSL